MNIRTITAPVKVLIMITMLFVEVKVMLILAVVLLFVALLPKISSGINIFKYSGYMRSPAGEVYAVDNSLRQNALSRGFKDLTLIEAAFLSGEVGKWNG